MTMFDARGVYVDPLLTNFSLGYQDQNYIADVVMPWTPTALPSGRYRVFNRNDWVYWPSRREPGTIANEVRGGTWSEDTFSTKQYSLQAAVTDEEVANTAAAAANQQANLLAGLQPKQAATRLITRSIKLQNEVNVANLLLTSANYTAGVTNTVALSGGARWDVPATAVPMTDIIAGMNAIYQNIGEYPNVMVIPFQVWICLANVTSILTRFQYLTAQYDIKSAIQTMTGFTGDIYVPNVVYNTADNIDATASMSGNVWGKNVWLGKVDATPGQNTQTFGKTFYQPINGQKQVIEGWRAEERRSDLVRITTQYDMKICTTGGGAGYLIRTVIS